MLGMGETIKLEDLQTLTPEQYRAIEDVVGEENVTIEPNLLDGYCFGWGSDFGNRPLGAVLPGSTEEVQRIVKICNRYKLQYRAHSTGFGAGMMNAEQVLSIDLRRMNRIIEVDEKNMIGVVEPYVSFAALMNACMKKGVRPYIIGAGPSASPLANVTSMQGFGTTNISGGWGGRVSLAVEWVLPDGELHKVGTLGTSGEWFCGDGPGPSSRGLMRGLTGTMGATGVFTKLAIKLVPWYGPAELESYGEPPNYIAVLPKAVQNITLFFPSRDTLTEALYRIQEEKIAYWCSRRGPFSMAAATTGSNQEVVDLWETGDIQKLLAKFNNNLSVGLDSSSPREAEFKKNCLMKIVEDLGGEEYIEDEAGYNARFVHGFNGLGAVKGTFRSTGGMMSNPAAEESIDATRLGIDYGVGIKNKYAEKGSCMDDGDPTWFTLLEDFGAHMEVPWRFDPSSKEVGELVMQHLMEANKTIFDKRIAFGMFEGGTPQELAEASPLCSNFYPWVERVKKTIDPNLLSGDSGYPQPKD